MLKQGHQLGLAIRQKTNIALIALMCLASFSVIALVMNASNRVAMAAPFTCSANYYQSQGAANTTLYEINIATNSATTLGSASVGYNTLGYNLDDNYMYAVREGTLKQLL